jgi:hypothetical protein
VMGPDERRDGLSGSVLIRDECKISYHTRVCDGMFTVLSYPLYTV